MTLITYDIQVTANHAETDSRLDDPNPQRV